MPLARCSSDIDYAIDQAAADLQGVSDTWTEPALSGIRGAPGGSPEAPHTGVVSVEAVRLPAAYPYASGEKEGYRVSHFWRYTHAAEWRVEFQSCEEKTG